MKILYLSLHPPLDPHRVATGNQVRHAGISTALKNAGHEVISYCPRARPPAEGLEGCYTSRRELAALIHRGGFAAIIVGYWELLAHLPPAGPPVVLDFIAPRLLEAMYQEAGKLQQESRQILGLLPRADHFLVGNQRQQDFLLSLLLLSGFDCREQIPISILPISTWQEPLPFERSLDEIQLLSAGVDWPWRQSAQYHAVLEAYCGSHGRFRFRHLTGAYPGAGAADSNSGLTGYRHMRRLFNQCHIGLELGRRNTEREFSHSFRLIEYLQSGLPVIVNSWLPAAGLVRDFNAGWIVDEPEELLPLLDSLAENGQILRERAEGARCLATHCLNYAITCRPLLAWLDQPGRPERDRAGALNGFRQVSTELQTKHLGQPGVSERLAVICRFIFGRQRPRIKQAILMVTRADLFPPDHGAAVKIIHTAKALSVQGRDVYLSTDNRREYYRFRAGSMSTHRLPVFLRLLALPRPVGLIRLLLKGFPWSNSFLYFPVTDASYILRALYLAGKFPIGGFHAEFPAYVRPCHFARRVFGGRVILVEHNVEYQRIRAQIPGLSARSYHRLKRLELAMCKLADAVVAVSDEDKATLIKDGVEPGKVQTIPHGVDLRNFHRTPVINVRQAFAIPPRHVLLVYHGTYSYSPNLQAMKVMAQELLPRLEKRGRLISVLAIGSRPPAGSLHPNIHFTGSIDNLAEVLPATDIAVVPLLEGGGTRMKILDYFAAGIPVISTRKGIEGIKVRHGQEALILDDYEEICDAVERLIENPQEAARLVDRARDFVDALSWEAIAERYLPLFHFEPPVPD